jgi:hypothetical protein
MTDHGTLELKNLETRRVSKSFAIPVLSLVLGPQFGFLTFVLALSAKQPWAFYRTPAGEFIFLMVWTYLLGSLPALVGGIYLQRRFIRTGPLSGSACTEACTVAMAVWLVLMGTLSMYDLGAPLVASFVLSGLIAAIATSVILRWLTHTQAFAD